MQNLTIQRGEFGEILAYSKGNITFTLVNSITYKKKGEKVREYTTHICKAYGENAEKVKNTAKMKSSVVVTGSYIDSHYKRKTDGKFAQQKHINCVSVVI